MFRKIVKILKWFVIATLSLFLIFIAYFFSSNKVFIGSPDENYTSYLEKNKFTVEPNFVDTKEELFDEKFYQNTIFLLGESHGFADVQQIDKSLLIYLNKKIGIRYYIAEMDSSTANNLTTFLHKETKDTLLLKSVVENIKNRIPQQSSQELYTKWLDIYDYNRNLSDSLKIIVLGIDKDFNSTTKSTIARDSVMLINLQNIIETKNLQNEKFYGLFGLFHVLQSSVNNNYNSLASHLKTAKFKVTSLVCYTVDSDMYLPKNLGFPTPDDERTALANSDGPLVVVKGINELKEVTKPNSVTLFNLNSKDSPYLKNQKLIKIKSNLLGEDIFPYNNQTVTVDYFQYVFFIRNSTSLTPLK